ncbi:chlorinating enzyme [Bradyrhizobium sp. SZCCHNR3015]|uniref:chlorinating enzyme n=1 Tax=Bradyrhizobium sp. SZCCHNR3015 TaxID=3057395 RepID=UPI002916CC0B|nr:chlorinating enzyme [Bradyrhizobium sp. SZCCHNR3015]
MPFDLSAEELARFDRDGFFGPFEVYERDEIQSELRKLRAALLDRTGAVYDSETGGNIANYDRHLDLGFLARHIRRPQIVDRVSSILGSDLLCWRTEFFAKYPGDEGTDWHQSRKMAIGSGVAPLLATEPHPKYQDYFLTLAAWTAFTDATTETSCMQYVPGSHEKLYFDDSRSMTWRPETINQVVRGGVKRGLFGYDNREIQVDPSWDPSDCAPVTLELSAGQCVLAWEATMHGSLPNTTTDRTRMAFVARYVPTNVRIYPNQATLDEFGGTADVSKWSAVVVSGVDTYGYNRIQAKPPG